MVPPDLVRFSDTSSDDRCGLIRVPVSLEHSLPEGTFEGSLESLRQRGKQLVLLGNTHLPVPVEVGVRCVTDEEEQPRHRHLGGDAEGDGAVPG